MRHHEITFAFRHPAPVALDQLSHLPGLHLLLKLNPFMLITPMEFHLHTMEI